MAGSHFIEENYRFDSGEYSDCVFFEGNNNTCETWPYLRWKEGTKFEDTRIKTDPKCARLEKSIDQTALKVGGEF